MEICPDSERPRYIANKRLLKWPNGAKSLAFSADEPDRLRGKQHMKLWGDELASWRYPEAWDQAVFGLRLGDHPQACCTTTPRPRELIKDLLAHPDCRVVRGSTHENRANLADTFYQSIISKYEGTRLGRQEVAGELIEIPEGAWFQNFSTDRHVKPIAYLPGIPVQLGIDIGVGRFCAAVVCQAIKIDADRTRFQIIADYLAEGLYSEQNAMAILEVVKQFPEAEILTAWLDPASSARTGIGQSALSSVEKVFGARHVARFLSSILDGLDQIELLLDHDDLIIHPRCVNLISAMKAYTRARSAGEWRDAPASPPKSRGRLCGLLPISLPRRATRLQAETDVSLDRLAGAPRMSNNPPPILETPGDGSPPSVETMLLNQVAILEAYGDARERAHVARWRQLQVRIADYRRRYPVRPPSSVNTFWYSMPPAPWPVVTGGDPPSSVGIGRRG